MNLSFYLLLKARGEKVQDHPVIHQLVKVRTYLEKLRPIEKRIGYQMDRLIKAAVSGRAAQVRVCLSVSVEFLLGLFRAWPVSTFSLPRGSSVVCAPHLIEWCDLG